MHPRYHILITRQVLAKEFSPDALQIILQANRAQDRLAGQIGHPEYHFDDSALREGQAYLDEQRQIIYQIIQQDGAGIVLQPAWQAFGRLVHAAQDFYAHTNYVQFWVEARIQAGLAPHPAEIQPLDPALLEDPGLSSGRNYLGLEILALLPGLQGLVRRLSPVDSHLRLNLDSPAQGPLFPFALAAAEKRTRYEYDQISAALTAAERQRFQDLCSRNSTT